MLSAREVMTIVFWDAQGAIYFDISSNFSSENDKTLTALYYDELLGRFDTELQKNFNLKIATEDKALAFIYWLQ